MDVYLAGHRGRLSLVGTRGCFQVHSFRLLKRASIPVAACCQTDVGAASHAEGCEARLQVQRCLTYQGRGLNPTAFVASYAPPTLRKRWAVLYTTALTDGLGRRSCAASRCALRTRRRLLWRTRRLVASIVQYRSRLYGTHHTEKE